MTFDQYLVLRAQTVQGLPSRTSPQRISYAILGLVGEAGEVADLAKKRIHAQANPELERYRHLMSRDRFADVIAKELGDVLWYWCDLCEALELDPTDVMAGNIAKLKERFSDPF